jgi:hypothetical protein
MEAQLPRPLGVRSPPEVKQRSAQTIQSLPELNELPLATVVVQSSQDPKGSGLPRRGAAGCENPRV